MSIEIYDKAEIVKKGETYYYFLKNGSKNCFTCPNQTIVANDFNNKYLRGQSRESNWHIIAMGDSNTVKLNKIAETYFNSPTSVIYGRIQFGNKTNIALFYAKKKKILDYDLLNETQKKNIDEKIEYNKKLKWLYTINLNEPIPQEKQFKAEKQQYNYGEEKPTIYKINDYNVLYNDKQYWNLNNL